MDEIQKSIVDAIKIQVNEKIKDLQFDKTCYGKVVAIRDDTCDVEISGEITQCKIRNGLQISVNDIVLVRLINNDFSNKFVDAKLGTVGDDVEVAVDWSDIIGKPSSSPSDIDDSVSKQHTHNNLSLLETITQTLVDAWNSAAGTKYTECLTFSTGTQLISPGKPYTMSHAPYATAYNDVNYELTNGIKASTNYRDSEYVGWEHVDVLDIDFDFEILRSIQKVIVSGLSSTSVGIYIPQSIEVLTSTDGVSYVSQDIKYPVLNTGTYKYSIELNLAVECRYVRVRVQRQPGRQFVFFDEIEIYAAAIGAVMGGTMLPTPSEIYRGRFFTLFDNINGDTTYVCNRTSSGEYIWKSIT